MLNKLEAIELLNKQVGKKYIFGYELALNDPNPKAYDCAELCQWFFFQAFGMQIPDGSFNQFNISVPIIEPDSLVEFDLGFLSHPLMPGNPIHHVVIYIGGDEIIHAKGTEYGVVRESASEWQKRNAHTFAGWRSIL